MANRISLTHLTFVGPGKAPATVDFGPRTTVIHGPSDTGKSFIVDAIDFMLRGSTLREIPQRAGYSTVLLGIRTPTGEDVTLTRGGRGRQFWLAGGSTVRRFSKAIGERLSAWQVPDGDEVRYDRDEQDLIAGDQLRSAHGKGVRAILHSAFTIGLAQYCFENDLPHPGFVVLDSPLVTYRPPKPGEASIVRFSTSALLRGSTTTFSSRLVGRSSSWRTWIHHLDSGRSQPTYFFTGVAGGKADSAFFPSQPLPS